MRAQLGNHRHGDWHAGEVTLPGNFAFEACEVVRQRRSPIQGAECAEGHEGSGLDLIHRLAAVGWAIGTVGILKQQALLD
jgi:hypothetical protein